MKTIKYISILLVLAASLTGCSKDNYDAPESKLTGRIVYQGKTLGLRSDGVQLELWQHGYTFFSKIPIFVNQDGTFSASVFDGDYKLVRLRGNGPWADNTDSIDVKVSGGAAVDVPVDPYFIISNETFQRTGTTSVSVSVNIQQVNTTRTLEKVKLYIGQTMILDDNNNAASGEKPAADITLSQPVSITVNIPSSLASKDYVYARAAVKTNGVGEYLYTQPIKVPLK